MGRCEGVTLVSETRDVAPRTDSPLDASPGGDEPGARSSVDPIASGRRRSWWIAGVAALVPYAFWWFVNDDAVITFAFARSWADGAPLGVAVPGMHVVEGYSNLGWLVVLAACARIGVPIVLAAKILGALALGATSFLLARTLIPLGHRWAMWCCLPSAGAVIWAASGLENAARDLLLVGLGLGLHRQWQRGRHWAFAVAGCSIGLVLVRPDGFVPVAVGLLISLVVGVRSHRWRSAIGVVAAVVGCAALLAWWRVAYFGWPMPNPVYAKSPIDGLASQLPSLIRPNSKGWHDLREYLLVSGLVVMLPASIRGVRHLMKHGYGGLFAVLVAPVVIAVMSPDWMVDGRFYTSPCWAICWSAAWGVALPWPDRSRVRPVIEVLVVLAVLINVGMGVTRWSDRLSRQVTRDAVRSDARQIATVAANSGLVHPLVLTPDAGAVMYDEPSVWLLDSAELNETILPHLGGDLDAAGRYLFDLQRPEIVVAKTWPYVGKLLTFERLAAEGYQRAGSLDGGEEFWVRPSAGAVGRPGERVNELLDRIADPTTSRCELAALARGVQQRSGGDLPERAAEVADALAARRGSAALGAEGSFASFILDPTDADHAVELVARLRDHDWADCRSIDGG